MWVAAAVHNTEIFRKVFRCIPDDMVTTWAAYKAFANHAEKFNRAPDDVAPGANNEEPVKVVHDGPGTHGAGGGGSGGGAVGQGGDGQPASAQGTEHSRTKSDSNGSPSSASKGATSEGKGDGVDGETSEAGGGKGHQREASGPEEAWQSWERDEMEALLKEVRGHLGESQTGSDTSSDGR
jgi:phospholipase D1/2